VLGDSNATYSGDGESLTIFTNGQEITAINMEQLELSDVWTCRGIVPLL